VAEAHAAAAEAEAAAAEATSAAVTEEKKAKMVRATREEKPSQRQQGVTASPLYADPVARSL
jgi:hypothetical protein